MAGINKKTWKTKNGIKYYYEITYYENGKQKKKGGYKSKLEAQIALKDVVTERNTEITLNKLSQQYLERHCTLNCKNSTITLYESYLKTIEPLLRLKAKDITKRHIENLILELKTRDMSNKSINGIVTFIQAILNYAVDNELISNNPIIRLKKLPQIKPPINFLNESQIDIFLQQAETCPQTYKAFFYTAIFTGMRRGELLALEWSDIDFKQNKIRVNKQIYRGITQTTKTGKERYIDMSERLKDVLIEHKQQGILSKYVFHINGKPLHPWNMEETYFKPLLKRCNQFLDAENQIIKLKFHDLRHTYATYLLSKNIPIKYVQQQLGHSTARMTLDTYANILPTIKNDAMDILNSLCYKKEKEAVF
jgi:integrase